MISDLVVKKNRVEGTVFGVKHHLGDIEPEDLITELFVKTKNSFAEELLKRMEYQLVLCQVDFERFTDGLYDFFEDTAKFIKDNKLYQEYFEFSLFIFNILIQKDISWNVVSAYQNLLIQLYSHLSPLQKLIYGISSQSELYITDEPYPYLEYPIYEWEIRYKKNKKYIKKIPRLCKEYGYDIKSPKEALILIDDDRRLTNTIFQMAPLIDESTRDIFSDNYYMPSRGIRYITREFRSTKYYKEQLNNRNNMLPFGGVEGRYENIVGIERVLYKERFIYDDLSPVLLFKITFRDGTCSSGFYDTKYKTFYTSWFGATPEDIATSQRLENFILENYWHMTCDVDITKKKAIALHVVGKDKELYQEQPIVEFILPETYRGTQKKSRTTRFKRDEYVKRWSDIKPFIRKLPEGREASEEARQRAREMGYILKEGETFVRAHKKTVYKKGTGE